MVQFYEPGCLTTIPREPPPILTGPFERCADCPYPGHGFVCWRMDTETCLRTDVAEIMKRGRAYITSRQPIFSILADGKVIGVPFRQLVKHQVHGVLKFLIVLPDLHRIYELNESGEILFLLRGLVVDVADQGGVKKRFGLNPEIVTALALPLGVGNQGRHQLQNVLFAVQIGKRIVVHGLLEIDRI